MHVLLTCKNENDPMTNEGAGVFTTFLSLYAFGIFSRRSRAANSAVLGRIWPNFKLIRDIMVVLVNCKNEEDPIKNEGARVFTKLCINYLDNQGQQLHNQLWNLVEIQTHPSFYGCPCYLQE